MRITPFRLPIERILKDPAWSNDLEMTEFVSFMTAYYPAGPKNDQTAYGYLQAMAVVQVLKQCGDEPARGARDEGSRQSKNFPLPLLLPGILINTSSADFAPIEAVQADAVRWRALGNVRRRVVRVSGDPALICGNRPGFAPRPVSSSFQR